MINPSPIHILFVEGDASDGASIQTFVARQADSYRLERVTTGAEAVRRLNSATYDIALLDYRFEDGTAFDVLDEMRGTPTIFLVDPGEEELAAVALRRGAYDFLIKDPQHNFLSLLPVTIQKVLARKHVEDSLQWSESSYTALVEGMLEMYVCLNQQGRLLMINRAGSAMLDAAGADICGRAFSELLHAEDRKRFESMIREAVKNPKEQRAVEFRLQCAKKVIPMAGHLWVQSARGVLPCVVRLLVGQVTRQDARSNGAVASMKPVAARGKPVAADKHKALRGTERLLVVDDQPDQRGIAAMMLSRLGYQVLTAESGRAALELMKHPEDASDAGSGRSPFDLVLMDMNLEVGFDGLDAYRKMLKVYPKQRCIIVSGCCESDRVKTAQELGAGDFVGKPYTFQTLGAAVRKELDASR